MNILIIKTGARGDVVRSSFLAQALRNKYQKKNPKIFWLTNRNVGKLFQNNPYVDYVVLSENKEKLRPLYFDIVINLEE